MVAIFYSNWISLEAVMVGLGLMMTDVEHDKCTVLAYAQQAFDRID